MNYAKDYKNDNHYVSVNTLIKSQKKSNLSLASQDSAMEQPESVQAADAHLPGVLPQDNLMNSNPGITPSGPMNPVELAPAPEDQAAPGTDMVPENVETGPAESGPVETTAATPAQGTETSTAEPVESGVSASPESETLPPSEDKTLEETAPGKESNHPKHKMMTAAASGADSDTGSRPPETIQLAGESTISGNDDSLSVTGDALNSMHNSGEPLPESLGRNMGNAMGTGFDNVRIHRDGQSAAIAGEMGAKAFTHREDIYFNQGQYNPDTTGGRHLIAHELAHVEQQRTIPGLQYKLEVAAERDRYEQEADAAADQVVNFPAPAQPALNNINNANQHSRPAVAVNSGNGIQFAKAESGSNWLLDKIGGFLQNIPGYDVLALIIGKDPVSGREVKRDGVAFVKAILGLIPGGRLLFENLEKANIISRAVAWFKEEFQKLNISFAVIKNRFSTAWKSLSALDALNPAGAFNKIKNVFMEPINRVLGFIGRAGSKLMGFIFEGALFLAGAPVKSIMGILNRGKDVLNKIISDPGGFLKNLLNAVQGGVGNFTRNIVTHLKNGIAAWLFGALGDAGITLPAKFDLGGIFSVAAQVLGLTWQSIRAKVVKRLGPTGDKVIGMVEKSIDFVVAFITKGPMALLAMAQEFLGELRTLFFDSLFEWLRNTIIAKAVQKLISMFNPVGAIIQAVITIYNVIQFFIERAKQIAAFVSAVFDSIAEIAAGNIGKAVTAVENALAKGLVVAIGFLASLIGLGGISKKVQEIIKKVRKPVDKIVDKVINFIVDKAKAIGSKVVDTGRAVVKGVKDKAGEISGWWKTRKQFKTGDGEQHSIYFEGNDENARLVIASNPETLEKFLDKVDPQKYKSELNEAKGLVRKIEEGKQLLQSRKEKDKPIKEKVYDELVRSINRLAEIIGIFKFENAEDYPPVLMPPFTNGVKAPEPAESHKVEFLSKKPGRGFELGTDASNSSSTFPPGWERLQKYGLTANGQWVKMHLISKELGGKAKSSNLTPARGHLNVQEVYRLAEKPAIAAINEGKMIWYQTGLGYHSTPNQDYIKSLKIEWGFYDYDNKGNRWKRSSAKPKTTFDRAGIEPPKFDEKPGENK
jgi:hypothetical protein